MMDGRKKLNSKILEPSDFQQTGIQFDQTCPIIRPSATLFESYPSQCNHVAMSSLIQSSPDPKIELLPCFHSPLGVEEDSDELTRPEPIRPPPSIQPTISSTIMLSNHISGFDTPSVIDNCARTSLHNFEENNNNNNNNNSIHGVGGDTETQLTSPPPHTRSSRVASILQSTAREMEETLSHWKRKKRTFDETRYDNTIFLIRNSMDIVRSQYSMNDTSGDKDEDEVDIIKALEAEEQEEEFVNVVLDQFTRHSPLSITSSTLMTSSSPHSLTLTSSFKKTSETLTSFKAFSATNTNTHTNTSIHTASASRITKSTVLPSSQTSFSCYQKY